MRNERNTGFLLAGLAAALGLALFLSPFASSPRWAGTDGGGPRVSGLRQGRYLGYALSRVGSSPWFTGLAGAVGTVAVFGFALLLGVGLRLLGQGRGG